MRLLAKNGLRRAFVKDDSSRSQSVDGRRRRALVSCIAVGLISSLSAGCGDDDVIIGNAGGFCFKMRNKTQVRESAEATVGRCCVKGSEDRTSSDYSLQAGTEGWLKCKRR
jgi:hypothetical protein